MADFNDPTFGNIDRLDAAINRLERRVNEAVARVEQVENANARRRGAQAAGPGRPIKTQAGEINAETAALEQNTRAANQNRQAKENVFRASGGTSTRPVAASDPLAATAAAQAERTRADALRRRAELQFQANEIEKQSGERARLLSQELRQQVAVYGSSSQALRKHGALTTEFIDAARRGNVTFAEMRYQLTATIGKFAGWTAAAAAVYGVVGAVGQIGSGAVDASNGVNQLERTLRQVDANAAIGGFRDQSRQFNLPIADVAAGQYELSKRFQDQNQSLQANEALLYAVKVGELSVADASRYLLATVNAFGLGAEDLLPLMDQYNNLQNRMGVRTADTAAGVAKAAGQWRAAGGDLEQLVAIIGAGTRVTGLPGGEFGTLLQRSAGLINRPKNQEILRSFGLDPKQGISDLYEEAFRIAPTLARDQLIKLAEGLSTPQLAPRLTALLGSPEFYDRALALVNPESASGSSERELNTVLDSFSERVKRLGTDLQQAGAAFAQAGGLAVPQGFIAGLDFALRIATDIFGVFARLPDGLQTSAVVLATIVALLRTARRFNLGDNFTTAGTGRFAGTAPGTLGNLLSGSPEKRTRQALTSGLDRELQFFNDERERIARQAAVARNTASFSQTRVTELVKGGPAQFRDQEEYNRNIVAAQSAANRARQEAVELSSRELALAGQIDETQGKINRYNEQVIRKRQVTARQFASQEGIEALPAGVGVPTTRRPVTADSFTGRQADIGPRSARLAQRLDNQILAYSAAATQWNAAVGQSRGATAVTRAAQTGVRATSRATTAIGVAGREALALGRGMGGLAGAIGRSLLDPLNLIILAAIGIPVAIDFVNRKIDEANDRLANIEKTRVKALTTPQREAEIKRLRDEERERGSLGERFQSFFQDTAWYERIPLVAGAENVLSFGGADNAEDRRKAEAKSAREYQENILKVQREARDAGRAVPYQGMREIDKQRDDDLNDFKRGAITEEELRTRMAQRLEEYRLSTEAQQGGQKALKREIDGVSRLLAQVTQDDTAGGLQALYAGLDSAAIGDRINDYLTIAQSGQSVEANLRRAAAGYTALADQIGNDNSPEALAQLAQARDTLAKGVEGVARAELDRALLFARSGADRSAAYRDYNRQLRVGLLRRPQARTRAAARQAEDTGQRLQVAFAARDVDLAELNDGDFSAADVTAGADLAGRLGEIERLKEQAKGDQAALRRAKREEREFRRRYREYREEIKRQQFQQEDALQAARDEYAASSVAAGLPRIRFQIARIGQRVQRAIRLYGRDSQEALQLINQQQSLIDQAAQEQEELTQSQEDLAVGRIRDPEARSRAQIQTLRNRVARWRADPQHHKESEINGLLLQIAELENQQAEEAEQRARDLADARFEYLISRTQDPVRRAALAVQQARAGLQGTTGADRYRARARLNDAQNAYRSTRVQERIDDINFDLEMEKITRDEAARRLEALARQKGITKQQRRDLILQAKRLREEDGGDYDLNVGEIKLPTMYEIRKAVARGKRDSSFTSINQEVNVNIVVEKDADAALVGKALEDALGTTGGAIARNMRLKA